MTAPTVNMHKNARLHWFHWVVISLSLVLTFVAWYVTKQQVEARVMQRFANESTQVIELVIERMRKYEDALWGGVAAIHSQSHGIDYAEWKRYADTLHIETKYPGINGLGVIHNVPLSEVDAYLKEQRENRPDFKIHPAHDQPELFPITYIEPVAMNAKAVGLDVAHETNRYEAAKKARETGGAQITGPIVLVQDSQKTPGFLFYVPYYEGGAQASVADRERTFKGLVYAPFIVSKLIEGTLDNKNRLVNISIGDGDDILYDEHIEGKEDYDPDPLFTKQVDVEMYGRPWHITIQSAASFRATAQNHQPRIILMVGIFIDALLFTFFVLLTRSNKRAIGYARAMSEQTSLILEAAPDGILSTDKNGRILSVNKALCELFGYKESELVGQPINKLIPERFHGQHTHNVSDYVNQKETKKLIAADRQVSGVHKDGTEIPLEIGLNKSVMSDGALQIVAIIHDITSRKKAENALKASRERLQLITEKNPDVVFVKDKEFRIVEANSKFMEYYPKDKHDKVIGYTTLEDYDEQEAQAFLTEDRLAFEKGYADTTETIHFPDGKVRTLYTQKIRYEDANGEPFILCISRDVSEREALIDELTESNEELERFAYVASHDLQEPLRMVTNFTQLLERKYGGELNDEAKQYIEFASSSAKRMQNLIDDLLEYARLGSDDRAVDTVNCNGVMTFVLENLSETILERDASIIYDDLPTVLCGSVRLSRVLQNLISNAIKYQPEDRRPIIHVETSELPNEWEFCVKDNGIGMQSEYCEQIFLPFNRLHNKSEYSGTGIGLAICRKIIEQLGGRIWVESEPDKGSRFYFTIPKASK